MKKVLFAAPLLLAGFVIGMLITDRVSSRSSLDATAGPPVDQARPAALPASTLPNLSDVAEHAVQASVNISSTVSVRVDPFFQMFMGGDTVRSDTSLGSGVIVSSDGYVLTNSHVVPEGSEVKVMLPDNRELPAKIVGVDEVTDLAVLKVDAKGLSTLAWGDSSKLRVAEWVIAVGNPFAFSQTVTLGIVSSTSRREAQLATFSDMIQTDAAINPGNSGGALVNSRGELIGINTMIYSRTGGYQGLGFAIPSNLARQVMDGLIKNGEIPRGDIGLAELRTVEPAMAERAGLGRIAGVLVDTMYRAGTSFRAGIQPGDIIRSVNGTAVTDANQLQRVVLTAPVGSSIKIELLRNRRTMSFDVKVEKAVRRESAGR